MEGKIKSFTDLNAWKEAHKLSIEIYKITKHFPKEEMFGLTSQMRRCAVSVVSNIAEGFSRETYREKIRFYSISLGSLTELQSQLLIAKDVSILDENIFKELTPQIIKTHKILNGLIRTSKNIQDSRF